MTITQKINELISSANAVTGENDTDLTSAVQHLKDGYGQGGTDDWSAKMKLPKKKVGEEEFDVIIAEAFNGTKAIAIELSPNIVSIETRAFIVASELEKLIIRKSDGIVSLEDDALFVFQNALILDGWEDHIGIFVPDHLCSVYANYTNWCSLYNRFDQYDFKGNNDDIPYYPFIPLSRLEGNSNG